MTVTDKPGLLTNELFVAALHDGIDSATERIFIQVMTFDGDRAGIGVAERLVAAAKRGVDVRLTVDIFAFRYVSDTRVTEYEVQDEVRETHAMFDRLEAAGVDVTYVGPWGPMLAFVAIRHHKKIFVIDDTAYLGGINVSDHNFAWFDFVVSLKDPMVVGELVDDFHATRRGERSARAGAIVTNTCIEERFDAVISSAEHSILIVSPYALDSPLSRLLAAANAREKVVVTPQRLNSVLLRWAAEYVRERVQKAGVDLQTMPDFFHAKFVLVDGQRLLVGSSNFGRHSFRCNQEVCVEIDDRACIEALMESLPETQPIDFTPSRFGRVRGFVVESGLGLAITVLEKLAVNRVPVLASRKS